MFSPRCTSALLILVLLPVLSYGQDRYFTRTGELSFGCDTKMGDVQAVNRMATSMFDTPTASLEVSVLVKAFEFEKAAMQHQFNNELMESDLFPKATFTGRVLGLADGIFSKPDTLILLVAGDLTIHGKARKVVERSQWVVGADGTVHAYCRFKVLLSDYEIRVPTLLKDVLSNEVEVLLALDYEKL